jgi:hypothetical protein
VRVLDALCCLRILLKEWDYNYSAVGCAPRTLRRQ